jgi:2,4-dienoyl-CoA reductase-like NADH-dependent reductase (Old Yellow Enzyme family)
MTKINNPLTLPCGQVIKNRVCKAAMTERIALGNNFTNEKHIELYKMWGAGDIGILLTGNVQVHRNNLEGPANVAIEEDTYKEQMPMLKKWAEAATGEGSRLWMQISHAGRQTPGEINMNPMSPSDVQLKIPGRKYGKPTPMTEKDIQDVINRFVFTAKIARESGFDGIQLHSAHGYLLSQFLSPDINQRADAWGGALENRARIHLEIIKKCREEVGNDFAISIKMNSADFQKGGFSPEDSIQVAKLFSDSGIDNIEISGGTYEQPRLLGLDKVSINPGRSENRKESTIAREAYFLSYAEEIAKVVNIPLMVTGGFRTKEGMEAALTDGACEIVGVGRPLCANPYAIKELLSGQIDELPKYEKTLSIGPWWLSPTSPFRLIQAINAFSAQAWFYQQIKKMGKGLMPDLNLKPWKAFREDAKADQEAIKKYQNF